MADSQVRLASLSRLAVILLSLGGVVLALACTRHGAGIGGDGVAYVAGARNILSGLGFSWVGPVGDVRPITIFGPLFPAALSALGLSGLDPLDGARFLNAALFGVNVALSCLILRRSTETIWPPILGAVMILFSPVILSAHSGVISEPTFLALLLSSMILLDRYLERRKRGWLALAAATAGLSYLARYVGLTVMISGLAVVLSSPAESRRRRWVDLAFYAAISGAVVAPWSIRNELAGGSATARAISFLLPGRDFFRIVADLVTYWFLPERLPLAWRLAALLAAGLALAGAWLVARRSAKREADALERAPTASLRWLWIVGLHLLFYSGGVFAARLFLVPRISVDERILLPVLLLVLLFGLVLISLIHNRAGGRRWLSHIPVAMAFLLAISYIGRGGLRALLLESDGQGLASRRWRESPLMNALSVLPPNAAIYTNEVEALYLLGGRSAYRLPTGCLPEDAMVVYVPGTECRTEEYEAWAAAMRRALEEEMAVVALFDSYREQPYYSPVVEGLTAGLDILTTQGDGRLFAFDRSQWPESPHW